MAVAGELSIELDETFVVNLSAPANATIADAQATGTIQNDDAPALTIADVSVTEGNAGTTAAVFQVSLTGPSNQTVTVDYATSNGSAVAPGDYSPASGTLTFPPGVTSRTIDVPVSGDALNEAAETFSVTLSNAVNIGIARAVATGTITDNDPLPALSIGDVTVAEGNGGVSNAVFTVTLSPASGRTVTVAFATASGTAVVGSDFTTASGTLTFNAGTTTQTVTVPVNGDLLNETDEQFSVVLSTPANATIADGTGAGTILNDDPVPSISIADAAVAEGNSGTRNAVFTLSLSAASAQTVTVSYATANGSATDGSDYTAASGTATFPPGPPPRPSTSR